VSLSFYEVSVGQYLQMLGATQHILRTAEANAEAGGIDLGAIVNFRLQDDMHPFSFQVVSIWHHSCGALVGMRDGLFEPPPSVDDTSWQGLSDLVDQAVDVLSHESEESMAALSDKTIVFRGGGMEIPFTNANFLLSFSLPNFYFHVTTVYDMLRIHGVPLGKLDFMGQMKMVLE
jgi:hypothetical protein